MIGHPRFRAAYDFLVLRAASGEVDQGLADWWTAFLDANEDERSRMTQSSTKRRRPRRRRKPVDGSTRDGGAAAPGA